MSSKKKQKDIPMYSCHFNTGNFKVGLFLLVLGGYFLARDLGWIAYDISIWPIILIFFGVMMMIPGRE